MEEEIKVEMPEKRQSCPQSLSTNQIYSNVKIAEDYFSNNSPLNEEELTKMI